MLLYLHIPFCDSKCHYCSFNSYTNYRHMQNDYMKAIIKQLRYELKKYDVKKEGIETLFIGGGTPSCIDANLYEPFFKTIAPFLEKDAEITIEANPNSATSKWLKAMKDLGVNRISFGVQSFNERKLKTLGRNHTPKMAQEAVKNANLCGFSNISIDLIYGTYIDNEKILQYDLDIAFNLPINHLSAYSLTIEKETKFYNKKSVKNDDEKLALWLVESIKDRGFQQYEISNFGKYRSKHNLGYWQYKDYIAIGSGAVGFMKNSRFYPHKEIRRYIDDPLFRTVENLSEEDMILEKTFLGLRSVVGVDRSIFNQERQSRVEDLIKEKKVFEKDFKIYNIDFFISDEIALYIVS